MTNKAIVDKMLESFVPMDKIFPPVADWHSSNTYATFGEDFKHAYYNNPSLYKDLRGKGKGTGLAIAYGGTEYTVAENLGISKTEAEMIVVKFNAGLPTFTKFAKATIEQAKKVEHVKDLFGRMRYLPHINPKKTGNWEKDKIAIKAGKKMERLAINAPIQMSGATQVKLMTINVGKYIETNRLCYTYGNLITQSFAKHIVSIPDSKSDEIISFLNNLEDGNIQVAFVNSDGLVTKKYSRLVKMTKSQIDTNNFTLHI